MKFVKLVAFFYAFLFLNQHAPVCHEFSLESSSNWFEDKKIITQAITRRRLTARTTDLIVTQKSELILEQMILFVLIILFLVSNLTSVFMGNSYISDEQRNRIL